VYRQVESLEGDCGMERKGLRVNMKKTQILLLSGLVLDVLKYSGKFPCAVYLSGVGHSSITCSHCKLWVNMRCNGIAGRMWPTLTTCVQDVAATSYVRGRDLKPSFCYVRDMHDMCRWWLRGRLHHQIYYCPGKLPILISEHISLMTQRKTFSAYVR